MRAWPVARSIFEAPLVYVREANERTTGWITRRHQRCLKLKMKFSCFAAARAACVSTWLGERPPREAWRRGLTRALCARAACLSRKHLVWYGYWFGSLHHHGSPNQVLTHAARAAAKQLNKVPFQAPLVAARGAREGLWLEQSSWLHEPNETNMNTCLTLSDPHS